MKNTHGGKRVGAGKPRGAKDKNPPRTRRPNRPTGEKKKESLPLTPSAGVPSTESQGGKVTPYPRVGPDVDKYGPRNLDFESKLAVPKVPPKEAKAGTPKGTSESQSELEVKIIADFLQVPFAIWAARIKFPQIKLTDQEALEWAEPTKVLADHYLPKIPPIAYAWFAWSVTTVTIVNKRIDLIAIEKEKREKAAPPQQAEPAAPAGPSVVPFAESKQGAPPYRARKV